MRLPAAGLETFRAYEGAALPSLKQPGGTLQRRSRAEDGLTEIHVIWFPSLSDLNAHQADPVAARPVSGRG
jgi:hypothetical protein